MFVFGEKVFVDDVSLKSHDKTGLFVGINQKGLAKVYLEEPLVCNKTVVPCITVAPEKLRRYQKSERDRIIERLDFLTHRSTELQSEMQAIDDEIFDLEVKLMSVGD